MSRLLLFAALLLIAESAFAAPVRTPHVEAELISSVETFQPGRPFDIALRLKIADKWHTYWRNPGDSGLPTKLSWNLPGGVQAGDIRWPFPKRLPLGPLMNFGYEGEALHLVSVQTPLTWDSTMPLILAAKAEWLVCSDVCIPENADLTLSVPAGKDSRPSSQWKVAFSTLESLIPRRAPFAGRVAQAKERLEIALPALTSAQSIEFYPYADDLIANAARQTSRISGDELLVSVQLADGVKSLPKMVQGVLYSRDGWQVAGNPKAIEIALQTVAESPGVNIDRADRTAGLWTAIALALVGGMLLNLMPCVFPVLGIKVLGFVEHAGSNVASLRAQGFAYLVGVLVSFWILAGLLIAFRASGAAIGWGFQLQSPVFVTLLALFFFAMALNLCGLFEIGLSAQRVAGQMESSANGTHAAFLSGVLATVVATPCTAPFMGAALGFTLSEPASVSLLVFTAVGFGMALPIVALTLKPAWLARLPKPGPWMVTVRQLLAFPLFATVVWLAWVLGSQEGNDAVARLLFGAVLIGVGAWVYGMFQARFPKRAALMACLPVFAGVILALPSSGVPRVATTSGTADGWQPYSPLLVEELRQKGTPIFVDFTATWCITCQVNKKVALNHPDVVAQFSKSGVALLRADWTKQDPIVTSALASFGRSGVPLYVYFPAHGNAKILPELLTAGTVLEALAVGPIAPK